MRPKELLVILAIACLLAGRTMRASASEQTGPTQPLQTKLEVELIGKPLRPADLRYRGEPPYETRENLFILRMQLKGGGPRLSNAVLRETVKDLQKKDLASEEIRAMLREGKCVVYFRRERTHAITRIDAHWYHIGFAAPTVKQAQELAQATIAVCNNYWKKNRQGYLRRELENNKAQIDKAQAELKEKEEQRTAIEKSLKGLDRILLGEGITGQLKTKLLMLNVELAGVRARLDAAQRFSEQLGKETSSSQKERLAVIMTTAQIDLAGLLAQQRRVSTMMDASDQLSKLFQQKLRLKSEISRRESYVKAVEKALTRPFKPVVVLRKATIQPIDWKNAE